MAVDIEKERAVETFKSLIQISVAGFKMLALLNGGAANVHGAESGQFLAEPYQASLNWEGIAALSSAAIALCAFGVTIWQVRTSQKHNRLSVKPFLTTWRDFDLDTHHYSIQLLNNGVGPAVINSFNIIVDGKAIPGRPSDLVENALKLLFPGCNYVSYHSYVGPGYIMSPKEQRHLVEIRFSSPNIPTPDQVKQNIERARLIIDYESIYAEKYCLDSDELRFMNRP